MDKLYFKNFITSWKQHTTMQLATLCVLVGTYTVCGIFLMFHQNLKGILTYWGAEAQLSVFLKDDIQPQEKIHLEKTLNRIKEFREVNYVSKDMAVKKFKENISTHIPSLFFDQEDENPLPSSFELSFNVSMASHKDVKFIEKIVQKIMTIAGVEDVSYGRSWLTNYSHFFRSFSISSALLVVLLLLGSLFIIGNSIRNSIAQRKEEIEVLELVGATPAYVRSPYIVEGALMGLLSSLIALTVCGLLFVSQKKLFIDSLDVWNIGSQLHFLSPMNSFILIMLGVSFGALGSFFCLRKINNGWSAVI